MRRGRASALVVTAVVSVVIVGCGKRGPPLPPLVRLPVGPGDFTATRRGDTVEIQFTVPYANTDNTRPANVERVEVYALEGGPPVNEDDFLKRRVKIANVAVKAPRNPDQVIEPEEASADIEPLEGRGLDQGAVGTVEERLSEPLARPEAARASRKRPAGVDETPRPLVGVWMTPIPARSYISLGVNKSGKKGPVSRPSIVPLLHPPPALHAPAVGFDENEVTVTWMPPTPLPDAGSTSSAGGRVLASRPIGQPTPALSYQVFEVTSQSPSGRRQDVRLTKTPVAGTRFADPRMAWGATRCYTVRAVLSVGALAIESDAPPPVCVTLKDTFPPGAPQNLTAVGSEGVISLIWNGGTEKDLDGYLVLRGAGPGDLKAITPAPIHETNFRDTVQPGVRYVYAVQAVDKAGNVSPVSSRVEETAR